MIYCGAYELQCSKCPRWNKDARKLRGCDGPAPFPILTIEDDTDIYECPSKLISDETKMFLNTYALCRELHTLPVEGGMMNQCASFFSALTIVGQVEARHSRDMADSAKKK